jgi:hypothetical protein
MADRWETPEDIAAAKSRFVKAIPGYEPPAAYGVGTVDSTGTIVFPRVNSGDHPLPAVVLATACGHQRGTRTYELSEDDLGRAIDLLAPAEACDAYEHPNLAAWRELRRSATGASRHRAVFVASLADPVADEWDAAFRGALPRL